MKPDNLPMVGRTRFELVTNGLKGRCALGAQVRFPLCAGRVDGVEERFLRPFCQNPPTMKQITKYLWRYRSSLELPC